MKKFNWGEFILGILYILVAIVSFKNPTSSLVAIVYVFAFSAIIKGVMELSVRRQIKEFMKYKNTFLLVLGVVDSLLGVFLLFNIASGLAALPFVFAIWFIFDSIMELLVSDVYKLASKGFYWFNICINVLGVILGILLLFNPLTSALTLAFLVGIYFMISGITYLIEAF